MLIHERMTHHPITIREDTSLDDALNLRIRLAKEFPQAALNLVQGQRVLNRSAVECEALARLRREPSEPVQFLNAAGIAPPLGFSAVAMVGPMRLALSGTQLAFGFTEPDALLAYQRLEKSLDQAGAAPREVVVLNIYPLSAALGETAWKARAEPAGTGPPAGTAAALEGLASLDAAFALDIIALAPGKP